MDDVDLLDQPLRGASREDMAFYAAAVRYGARYLVTGNAKHYPTGNVHVKIVSPRQFVTASGA